MLTHARTYRQPENWMPLTDNHKIRQTSSNMQYIRTNLGPLFLQQTTSELWCLFEGKRGDYQNCSVLYCVLKLCSHKHAYMSSSYSSLDWVLSQWVHFTVHSFICVYVFVFCVSSYCIFVVLLWARWGGWTWWDWSLILSVATLLVRSFDP